jgi:hypothetical protein
MFSFNVTANRSAKVETAAGRQAKSEEDGLRRHVSRLRSLIDIRDIRANAAKLSGHPGGRKMDRETGRIGRRLRLQSVSITMPPDGRR